MLSGWVGSRVSPRLMDAGAWLCLLRLLGIVCHLLPQAAHSLKGQHKHLEPQRQIRVSPYSFCRMPKTAQGVSLPTSAIDRLMKMPSADRGSTHEGLSASSEAEPVAINSFRFMKHCIAGANSYELVGGCCWPSDRRVPDAEAEETVAGGDKVMLAVSSAECRNDNPLRCQGRRVARENQWGWQLGEEFGPRPAALQQL